MANKVLAFMDTNQENRGTTGEQLLLFQDRDMLFNRGVLELARLNLGAARDAFNRYRELYHDRDAIDKETKLADFLIKGFSRLPDSCPEKPAHLYRLWTSFENYLESVGFVGENIVSEIKYSFFRKIREALEQCNLTGALYIADTVPTGYVYIQLKEYSLAIQSLQACIPSTPDNAAIYGYLGDAYMLRGEPGDIGASRQCYLEAYLIDPGGIDWRHIKDMALLKLRDQIIEEQNFEDSLALEWLPSHAYIEGIFKPKTIELNNGLKEFVDEYLKIKKAYDKKQASELKARLFIRSMILCDNEDSLKFIKRIDFMDIRRLMKDINPDLFRRYLKWIESRNRHKGY
jgi:tetratricopeptide (TPR) repeat protein